MNPKKAARSTEHTAAEPAADSNSTDSNSDNSMSEQEYLRTVGERLRVARQLRGLSRREVQENSGGRWKSGAIGMYERGHRAITVVKLAELAEFYQYPVAHFFPDQPIRPTTVDDGSVVLDLRRIPAIFPLPADPLVRYASAIAAQRTGPGAQALTIRASDLISLAVICNVSPAELTRQLTAAGVLAGDVQVA